MREKGRNAEDDGSAFKSGALRFPSRISLESAAGSGRQTAMKEVFRNADSALVALYQSVLEAAGIQTFIHNTCTQQAMVGGLAAAFFPVPEFFPRLSVLHDVDFPEAMGILRSLRDDAPGDSSEARCPHCDESVPANFTTCWKCENEMTP